MGRRYWVFLLITLISRVCNGFMTLVIPVAMYRETQSPVLALLAFSLNAAPYVLAVPLGVIIDSFDRRAVYFVSEFLQALIMLFIFFALGSSSIGVVMVLLFLAGLCATTSKLTSDFGIVPSLVPESMRHKAYTIYNSMGHAAVLTGPLIAGFVVSSGRESVLLLVNALSFLLTASVSWLLPKSSSLQNPRNTDGSFRMLLDGFAAFKRQRDLQMITICLTVFNLGVGGVSAVMVLLFSEKGSYFIGNPGAVISAGAACGIAGSLIGTFIRKVASIPRLTFILFIGGFCSTVLMMVPKWQSVLLGYCLLNFFAAGINTSTTIFRQDTIDKAYIGRVNSIIRTFVVGATPLSALLLGFLMKSETHALKFLSMSALTFVASVIWGKFFFKGTEDDSYVHRKIEAAAIEH